MTDIPYIKSEFIESHTDFRELVETLREGFRENKAIVPLRHHHDFPNPSSNQDTTLLLMPAWSPGTDGGVKVISVSPDNGKLSLPSIQGNYIYLDANTGVVKAIFDAKPLTTKRTAAASALASSFLSRPESSSLLMIGTGALAPELINAHASVRPIEQVYIWGRSFQKAQVIAALFKGESIQVKAIKEISQAISDVDIISSATFSKDPLINGSNLRPGQHVDLVGSYKPDMREADDEVMHRSSIFVDYLEGALKETGDIIIPMQSGVIKRSDIKADLFDLCQGNNSYRQFNDEITVFKSVGHALEDLVAARYFFNQYRDEQNF